VYLDSCIAVKLIVEEADSEAYVRALTGQPLAASELLQNEVFSTLLFKERSGAVNRSQRQRAWNELQRLVAEGEIRLLPLDANVLNRARLLIERCHPAAPLRSLDAIHAATCDLFHEFPLCTADTQLGRAAQALGLPLHEL
jgi:predicted nucleic acid-binding protein